MKKEIDIIIEEHIKYRDKFILCKESSKRYKIEKNKFYKMTDILLTVVLEKGIDIPIIHSICIEINDYIQFFNFNLFKEHFELKSKEECRKDKISKLIRND